MLVLAMEFSRNRQEAAHEGAALFFRKKKWRARREVALDTTPSKRNREPSDGEVVGRSADRSPPRRVRRLAAPFLDQ